MTTPCRGTLSRWNDERGFGFIAPAQGGPEVFVHASAFARDGTRPTVGERVRYELGRGRDGRPQATTDAGNTASFHCDGRTYCSQMTSCAEAKWFLNHCPGTRMDGNNDGVPCEQQWCTSPFAK